MQPWGSINSEARRPPCWSGMELVDRHGDICLTEQSVSRQHAVITVVAGQIVVDASSSTNGISRPVSRSSSSLLLGTTFSYPG